MYSFDFNTAAPQQGIELAGISINPVHDEAAIAIATYVADGLNYDLYQRTGQRAVQEILDYDGLTVDTSRFPLLKVYRISDEYPPSGGRTSNMALTYSLLAPQQEELPGILNWFSVCSNFLLDSYALSHEGCCWNIKKSDRRAEYKIMLNEINSFAYPFFRIPFEVEFC